MKIAIYSDLHVEFGKVEVPSTESDVVVLAGDIGVGKKVVDWIAGTFSGKPVVYVLGNHEFYGQDFSSFVGEAKHLFEGTLVTLLENDSMMIGDVEFFGCTLWTDFMLFGDRRAAFDAAVDVMSDYLVIKVRSDTSRRRTRKLLPGDTVRAHTASVNWLRASLTSSKASKKVVVTHHAPLRQCVPDRFTSDLLSATFVSDLHELVQGIEPDLWIYGHTHDNSDFMFGKTRIVCNQGGYPGEHLRGFQPSMVIEL